MSSYAIRFINARVGYDESIIKDITLTIPRPGLTTILGPNGSGKTTLLRSLIKYAKVFGGYVFIDGKDVRNIEISDLPKYVSYSPAEINSQMLLTVRDVILSTRKGVNWVTEDDALSILRYLGIQGLMKRKIDELSTGQKRLVLIARSLVSGAPLMLIDEPTSNLDLGNKYRIIRVLRGIVDERGAAVVVASHDIDVALASDWVVAVRNGELVAVGSPYDVIRDDVLSELYGVKARVVDIDGHKFAYVIND